MERLNDTQVEGVLVDVDGTLYRQIPLRARMILELLKYILLHPVQGLKTAILLREFRENRESLRDTQRPDGSLEQLQYEKVATKMKISVEIVRDTVEDWIMQKPLKHLMRYRRPGLSSFLKQCRDNGIKVGVLSDYPSRLKLETMGINTLFSLNLCSTDAEINTFKPSPVGILLACRIWEIAPEKLVYIGDRTEIDGTAASAAGAQFILVGHQRNDMNMAARDFHGLGDFLQ